MNIADLRRLTGIDDHSLVKIRDGKTDYLFIPHVQEICNKLGVSMNDVVEVLPDVIEPQINEVKEEKSTGGKPGRFRRLFGST